MNDIKTIPTTEGRELILVLVAINTGVYCILNEKFEDSLKRLRYCLYSEWKGDKRGGIEVVYHKLPFKDNVDIKLLGTISGNYEADFDVEPFVERLGVKKGCNIWGYKNYTYPYDEMLKQNIVWNNPKPSFQSLLNANDCWMHNKIGDIKPNSSDKKYSTLGIPHSEKYLNDFLKWEEAQNKVVSKYVVLIKKK